MNRAVVAGPVEMLVDLACRRLFSLERAADAKPHAPLTPVSQRGPLMSVPWRVH